MYVCVCVCVQRTGRWEHGTSFQNGETSQRWRSRRWCEWEEIRGSCYNHYAAKSLLFLLLTEEETFNQQTFLDPKGRFKPVSLFSSAHSSLCFQFLLPVIQICLMCLCIGGDPKGIQVAVVNNETSSGAYSRSLLSFLDNTSISQVPPSGSVYQTSTWIMITLAYQTW